MDGEYRLAAFDRAHTAPDVDLDAIRLAREGDYLAGQEDAETGRADGDEGDEKLEQRGLGEGIAVCGDAGIFLILIVHDGEA